MNGSILLVQKYMSKNLASYDVLIDDSTGIGTYSKKINIVEDYEEYEIVDRYDHPPPDRLSYCN